MIPTETTPLRAYEFGEFRLELGKRLLRSRDGNTMPLTPRVFDTLLYMVEHHDIVLDKERIMEAVWPDSIVEENNLTQNISTLRRILGETPGSHSYIVTVPGRGYRFVADVRSSGDASVKDGANGQPSMQPALLSVAPEPQPDKPSTSLLRRSAIVAALLILGSAAAFFLWQRPSRSADRTTGTALPEKSIAVLPFDNLSDDKQNAYFAVGVQDEILSNLSKIADLKVISRTSANLYQTAHPRNSREVGQQLGVAHLVEGSVQRVGDRVRVNAQLIDTRTDAHLWAQSYDRTVADVFAIQAEIAQTIAQRLQAQISPETNTAAAGKPTQNPDAYLLYLRGREAETGEHGRISYANAIQLYQRAVDLDPTFALARSRLSICAINAFRQPVSPRATEYLPPDLQLKSKASSEAEEALRLQPRLGEAHLAAALCYLWGEGNDERALAELRSTAELLPNSAEVPLVRAFIHKIHGRLPERLAELERAETLDPRNRQVLWLTHLTYRWMRNWSESIHVLDRISVIAGADNQPELAGELACERAFDEFHLKSDVAPFERVVANSITSPPTSWPAGQKFTIYTVAMLKRDYARAAESLEHLSPSELDGVDYADSRSFQEAILHVARGDDQASTEAALAQCEARLARINSHGANGAGDPFLVRFNNALSAAVLHSNIGILEALRGHKVEAIAAANEAIARYPEPEGIERNEMRAALALVYARVGEHDKALELIEHLLTVPAELPVGAIYNITVADLKWSWVWDPLRGDPRFQKLLASAEANAK